MTLVEAAKLPRKVLLENLSNVCSVPFSPICITAQGKNDVIFYVEKAGEANAIKECNKVTIRINTDLNSMSEDTPKEYKLNIRVVSSRPPEPTINSKGNTYVILNTERS